MSSKVLWCSTDGHLGLIDLYTNSAPISQGIEIHTSLNKRLSEFFSPGLQSVSSDRQRPLGLISFKELDHFRRIEEIQEMRDELKVVAVILVDKILELLDVVFSALTAT